MRATFDDLIGRFESGAAFEEAYAVMRDDFVRRRRPQIAGSILASYPVVEADTRLVMRPNLAWRLAEDDKGLELLANGRTMRFRPDERQALERALSGEPFGAADLGGRLDGERALGLARRLAEAVLVMKQA
jgi:hypothetical protein